MRVYAYILNALFSLSSFTLSFRFTWLLHVRSVCVCRAIYRRVSSSAHLHRLAVRLPSVYFTGGRLICLYRTPPTTKRLLIIFVHTFISIYLVNGSSVWESPEANSKRGSVLTSRVGDGCLTCSKRARRERFRRGI